MRLRKKRFPGTENLIAQLPSEVFAETDGWDASLTAYIEDGKTGGVNPGDRRLLYQLTRRLKPRNVLEIGTHVGASTMHIAAAKPRSITTVDIVDVNAPELLLASGRFTYVAARRIARSERKLRSR